MIDLDHNAPTPAQPVFIAAMEPGNGSIRFSPSLTKRAAEDRETTTAAESTATSLRH